jgi:hypothetical protein
LEKDDSVEERGRSSDGFAVDGGDAVLMEALAESSDARSEAGMATGRRAARVAMKRGETPSCSSERSTTTSSSCTSCIASGFGVGARSTKLGMTWVDWSFGGNGIDMRLDETSDATAADVEGVMVEVVAWAAVAAAGAGAALGTDGDDVPV